MPKISFAAICDGRPDDQLSSNPDRLHTFAIIQDLEPSEIIACAVRVSSRMRRANLSSWAGRSESYKIGFANALKQELSADGGRIRVFEATEGEMIRTERKARDMLTSCANYKVQFKNGVPFQISAGGQSMNQRTQVLIEPKARWGVGVVVAWMALAITDLFNEVASESERLHGETPYMVLLPDRLPLDSTDKPGATSLLHAILYGTLRGHLYQQYSGISAPDNEAEKLVDNIVGLFNERHSVPGSNASQLAVNIMNDSMCSRRIAVSDFGPENLVCKLSNESLAEILKPLQLEPLFMSAALIKAANSL